MKCLYIGIVLFSYNYMMISGQDLPDRKTTEEIHHISIDNHTEITNHCPKNMSLHQVDDKMNVSICECKSRFLYFSWNDSCYEAYSQGPCPSKNYFVLPENETMPRCVENPCPEDSMVPYNGTCYPFKTIGPCKPEEILDVDEMTFQLKCIPFYVPYYFTDTPTRKCPSGSRRSLKLDVCRKVQASPNLN